ncbi:hypothetical protein BX661DRAFT_175976 [Kickxella alabastrina]|uniref:uncharacterized protein n=1 Tax=Kickxella alabastrina TaxID=61397 RepID=UPI00221EB424|nr:uncharacterized protein BX661DRAFT_175976 [Kickxella alabastrina]KAI7835028.1 hypothetical protein BX661DRAFT_175976 [Kickxella alabastrina]
MDSNSTSGVEHILLENKIVSTEDLTRALRSTSLGLSQRVSLARAVFDSSKHSDIGGKVTRLSNILVRKNELLAEWIFSIMLRELKASKSGKQESYVLYRDSEGIDFLGRILENIADTGELDVRAVLQGPVMALFTGAFASEFLSAEYAAAVARLWKVVFERAVDGAEVVAAQADQLAQLNALVIGHYLRETKQDTRLWLQFMVGSIASAMRASCETTLNARKTFALFDKELLPLVLRLLGTVPAAATIEENKMVGSVLDMIQAGLFHPDSMVRFAATLGQSIASKRVDEGADSQYVDQAMDIIVRSITEGDERVECAVALPHMLQRYLSALAMLCAETRGRVTTSVGAAAIAASPVVVSSAEAGGSSLAMFLWLYARLFDMYAKLADVRILRAINSLVRVYFTDACFGTTAAGSGSVGDVHERQAEALHAWLKDVVSPVFARSATSEVQGEELVLALEGVRLALDAAPEVACVLDTGVFHALTLAVSVPDEAVTTGADLLRNMVATLARARQLDTLIAHLAKASAETVRPGAVNLLASADFQRTLAGAIVQTMPFAQVRATLDTLADAISGASAADSGRKRRRLSSKHGYKQSVSSSGVSDIVVAMMANFVMAGTALATAASEQQRVQFGAALEAKHEALTQALTETGSTWEGLLIHYALVEGGARIGGSEDWLAVNMNPQHVLANVLPQGSDDCRTGALSMLVAFQAAAHWAATSTERNGQGDATVRQMVSAALANIHAVGAWGAWDGQAHTISVENSGRAQWQLLSARLEIACEYADAATIAAIARRVVEQAAAGDYTLLADAGFFEIARLRTAMAPAAAAYAAELWASKQPRSDALLPAGPAQVAIDAVLASRPKAKSVSTMDDASPWIGLLRALLRFPTVYWPADQHSALVALALAADRRVAAALQTSSAQAAVRVLARTLLERLLAHHPATVSLLVPHATVCADHWAAATGEHEARASRRLLRLTASALAQSAGASEQADAACLRLCTHLLKRLEPAAEGFLLVLDALDAVARAAAKLHRSGVSAWKKWVKSSIKVVQRDVLSFIDSLPEGLVDDRHAIHSLGVLVCLDRLLAALDGSKDSCTKYATAVVLRTTEALGTIAARALSSSSTFAMGLVLHAVHRSLEIPQGAAHTLLALLARLLARYHRSSGTSVPLVLQSLAACIIDSSNGAVSDSEDESSMSDFVTVRGLEPLLRHKLDAQSFETSLVTFLRLPTSINAVAGAPVDPSVRGLPKLLQAYIHTGYRHSDSVAKRKSVQRRLGDILVTLHTGLRTGMPVPDVLDVVGDLVLEPFMRFTMYDISECLSILSTTLMLPQKPADDLDALYRSICRILGSVIRHHTNHVLGSISILTTLLRSLMHAFVAPAVPRVLMSNATQCASDMTPWIISHAPLSPACAESYSRVLNDLVRSRRTAGPSSSAPSADLVKLTRGTNAAGVSTVLSLFAPHVLAEYCIIQGGGALSAVIHRAPGVGVHSGADAFAFKGLSWRPSLVINADQEGGISLAAQKMSARGIISSPALREALLPGWHALLDIMTEADRSALLALLAASGSATTDSRSFGATGYGGTSVFGPDRHGGAHEVLKSLYQTYLDFYKYKGEV